MAQCASVGDTKMLEYARVKNHAGMMLIGDYRTLRALHDLIHKLADSSALFHEPAHD